MWSVYSTVQEGRNRENRLTLRREKRGAEGCWRLEGTDKLERKVGIQTLSPLVPQDTRDISYRLENVRCRILMCIYSQRDDAL